jgi:hypothetical protein
MAEAPAAKGAAGASRRPYAILAAQVSGDREVQGRGLNRALPFTDAERDTLAAFEPFLRRAADDRAAKALVIGLDRAVAARRCAAGADPTYEGDLEYSSKLDRDWVALLTSRPLRCTATTDTCY